MSVIDVKIRMIIGAVGFSLVVVFFLVSPHR